jgi:hypothetical protein
MYVPLKASETLLVFGHLLHEFYFCEQVIRVEFYIFQNEKMCIMI